MCLYLGSADFRASSNLTPLFPKPNLRSQNSEILQQKTGNSTLMALPEAVNGTIGTQRQIVQLEWAWLALATIFFVVALALIISTCHTKTENIAVGICRTSPLTHLFHGRMGKGEDIGSRAPMYVYATLAKLVNIEHQALTWVKRAIWFIHIDIVYGATTCNSLYFSNRLSIVNMLATWYI